jgi:low temperature requirement protein LtrA
MLGLTGLMLVAAILIPVATAPGISIFGIAYALIKLGALFLYRMETLGDSKHTAAVRSYVTKASIAPLIVFFASALAPEWRVTAWTLALAIEIGSALLVGNHVFRIHASHFAERHSLVLIIVLGEAVVALGGQAVAAELTAPGIAGLFGGFMLVATLWWSYFAWAGDSTEQWLKGHGRPFSPQDHAAPSRMARDAFTFGHFPLVAGIIAIAVGLKDLAAEPLHAWHPEARVAMAVGLVLYLGGFVAVVFRGNGYILWERLVALIAMVVTTLVSPLPAGGTAVLLGAELVTAIALEMRRWNRIMAAKA